MPNSWLIENHLDILDNNVLNEDPSGDGFSNLVKWQGMNGDGSDAYNPWDPKSHPPYYSRLRLAQYYRQPFRLLFNAYDGDPKKPESMDFQINTIDINQPSQFVKIGDVIPGTKFKVIKFEFKQVMDPNTLSQTDVSELTVQNTENGDLVVLVLEKESNSPDSYAIFHYLWDNSKFAVKKGKDFNIPPEKDVTYKLIDITDAQAVIQLPTGKTYNVPLDTPAASQASSPPSSPPPSQP